ncbi:hypothetical protein [Mucilaginibacter arboris]|uniref:Uncharacterized protein n=1 Tax=Mucilaginibacter arboris TaxID=2682090 RepID=A0A7K1SV02_9SPHI|nr:hypothetical protein [Mucilaginibacter arboris]MVN21172.1 hypothetical protein [Mucilaginibacter arboris]
MKKAAALFLLLVSFSCAFSQEIKRFNPDTVKTIVVDTAVATVRARGGLYVQDFIDQILRDTSFYEAFRNMKKYAFTAENRVYTYNKNDKVEGKIYRKLSHSNVSGKHKIQYLARLDSGQVYKHNGKYELYTVEMFDYIFMNAYNSDFVKGGGSPNAGGKNESYKDKLKTLIFSPGRPISGIPFISKKTEIFSPDMKNLYRYEFARGTYLDSIPVYRFKVIQRPDLLDGQKDDVMIKELTTIFDRRNFQILGRYVDMKFKNFVMDFNVQMDIELNRFDGELLPTKISYQGNWDVPFHKEERASFLVLHKDYQEEK